VITMYSKNGGKAGAHSFTQSCENGIPSYLLVQTYEHSYRRQFKSAHSRDSALGTIRFAHLPSSSFLAIVPLEGDLNGMKLFTGHVEIGLRAYHVLDALIGEKELLSKAVASLNTVRRKGMVNIDIVELAEDDGVAE
ncbi:hypothetical protein B0H11DRAFT_1747864, partial [Mycena galericulata]